MIETYIKQSSIYHKGNFCTKFIYLKTKYIPHELTDKNFYYFYYYFPDKLNFYSEKGMNLAHFI